MFYWITGKINLDFRRTEVVISLGEVQNLYKDMTPSFYFLGLIPDSKRLSSLKGCKSSNQINLTHDFPERLRDPLTYRFQRCLLLSSYRSILTSNEETIIGNEEDLRVGGRLSHSLPMEEKPFRRLWDTSVLLRTGLWL